ncbi:MAG: hypothetical protein IKK18_02470 [Clostridia bacterium]|nr:hypothetical protein [Clostridia bacterium]
MRAIDVFDLVIRAKQKELLIDAVPEKRDFVLSDEFFNTLKTSALEQGFAEVSPTLVKIVENHDTSNALNQLQQEVNEGFWVYSFTCSMDYHEFRWCANEEEALKVYNSIEVAFFVSHKYIIHTTKGVLMKQLSR